MISLSVGSGFVTIGVDLTCVFDISQDVLTLDLRMFGGAIQ